MRKNIQNIGLLSCCIFVIGCSSADEEVAKPTNEPQAANTQLEVSGGKVGVYTSALLSASKGTRISSRPSGSLGVFASMYLSQGAFIPSSSAKSGITAQLKLLAGQQNPQSSEVFSLMMEYGTVLQVDIVDTLNRSDSRDKALDGYMTTLRNMTDLMKRKEKEMETTLEELQEQRKVQRKEVQSIERVVKDALRDENYEIAGNNQEKLAESEGELVKIETRMDQTKDMINRFGDLIEVGEERIIAIARNRRIILAGLKVVDVPGIDEFDLIDETKKSRKKNLDILKMPTFDNTPSISVGDN